MSKEGNAQCHSYPKFLLVFKGAADYEKKPRPLVFFQQKDIEESPYLQISL